MGKDKIPVLVSIRENNLGEESIFIFDPLFKLAHKYLKNYCRELARVQQKLRQRRHQKRISRSCNQDNCMIPIIELLEWNVCLFSEQFQDEAMAQPSGSS